MNYFYSLFIYLLGGLLFLLPNRALAQETLNIKSVELIGEGNTPSNVVFDYRRSEIRNQLCIPPEVLCLPVGTQIHAISIPYRINIYDGSTLTQSLSNMRIALGETTSMPDYKNPYSYIEEGMDTYYEGGDQLEVTNPSLNKWVTYNFSTPFNYQGGYLLVDLKTTTPSPITQNINISTSYHEFESILNMSGQNGQQPRKDVKRPNFVLGVTIPSGHAVPYIPLMNREQIVGYAEQGGSSEVIPLNINNLGDQPLTVTGLNSSNFKLVETSITIPVGDNAGKIPLQYTPQSAGTHEENVQLQTTAGNIEMKLSGTTYRQAPYSREITVSCDKPIKSQLSEQELQTITELSIKGQLTNGEIAFAFTLLPNLTKLDMSAAVSSDTDFYVENGYWTKFEQLALPTGLKNMRLPLTAINLTKLILPLGFEGLSGDIDQGQDKPALPSSLTTLVALGTKRIELYGAENNIETVYVPEKAIDKWNSVSTWWDKEILPITDAVLQPGFGGDVLIRDEQVFTEDDYPMGEVGISIKPNESQVTASAGLQNQAPVQIKELSLSYRLNSRQPEWGESPADGLFLEKGAYSAFINENDQATLQKVSYSLKLQPQKWHFISFPFDVDRDSIISAPENGGKGYVIRRYDGQSRANNGMYCDTNWQDVTDKLSAGCGYILQTDRLDNNNDTYKLSFL